MLRAQGKTYAEIRASLDVTVPKSTLSGWCQDVEMPAWYQAKVDELNKSSLSKAQRILWVSIKLKREKLLADLQSKNRHLAGRVADKDVLKMLLSILYLGEGSKSKGRSGLSLGSSDPNIILLYLKLLEKCYDIPRRKLKCRVSYRADQDIRALERYWARTIGIPRSNFYKTIPDPRTVGKPTKNLDYKGVCVIIGGSVAIQLELELIPSILLRAF